MVLNFASFLEENKYFEDAFRVYEKVGYHYEVLHNVILRILVYELSYHLGRSFCSRTWPYRTPWSASRMYVSRIIVVYAK